ncbi:MAG: GGDEF domain-containing protein [Gammaproteobacteria bacterium]|nr:GGDEF domain-containing protein [Gammaproteobacteria bacterium]
MPRQLILTLISPLLMPAVIIGGIYFSLANLHQLPAIPNQVWQIGPHLSLALLLLLSLVFNRSRLFYVTILVTLLTGIPSLAFPETYINLIMFGLFPANVILILGYQERGIFTSIGLWRLAFILLQPAGLYALWHFDPALVQTLITTDIANIPEPIQDLLVYSPFNPLLSIILGLNGLALLISVYWQRSSTARVIFTATIAVLAGPLLQIDNASDALIMASAMLMAFTILRDSHQMAYLDELTGLPQRRALNENLLILGRKFSIAMLDIDHFKKFNDKHGHDVGDQVLQMVSRKLRQVRGSGKVYRYGGEEFSIVFPGREMHDASFFLEEVRKSIQDYEMVIRQIKRPDTEKSDHAERVRGSYRAAKETVSVTISIGVAQKSSRAETAETVLKKADVALYKAKKAGRNQLQQSDD